MRTETGSHEPTFQKSQGDCLFINTPDEATRSFMESEYADAVHASIRDLNLPYSRVAYQLGPGVQQPAEPDRRIRFSRPRRIRSISSSTSTTSSLVRAISSLTRRPRLWRRPRRALTTRCLYTAESEWARLI